MSETAEQLKVRLLSMDERQIISEATYQSARIADALERIADEGIWTSVVPDPDLLQAAEPETEEPNETE